MTRLRICLGIALVTALTGCAPLPQPLTATPVPQSSVEAPATAVRPEAATPTRVLPVATVEAPATAVRPEAATPSRVLPVATVADSVTPGTRTIPSVTPPTSPGTSCEWVNAEFGYVLQYPCDWHVTGSVVATEFAAFADCQAVEVVDFEPPPDAGSSVALRLHSFVQICVRPVDDDLSLDATMRQQYGDAFASRFHSKTVGGVPAYEARKEEGSTTIMLQTGDYRIQISTAVVAAPEKRSVRISQVEDILASFRLT